MWLSFASPRARPELPVHHVAEERLQPFANRPAWEAAGPQTRATSTDTLFTQWKDAFQRSGLERARLPRSAGNGVPVIAVRRDVSEEDELHGG
jgi:hypothetical protein